ncbi:MAG: hypothetical protein IJW45_05720 [Oscillospiraceae bacterium]|nr:hypothetical protein [Oscillospiraceae bacterium]
MKGKLHPCLTTIALSFCLGYGGLACMVTGLHLRADLLTLGILCLFFSALWGVLLSIRRGGRIVLGIFGLAALLLWGDQTLRQETLAMLDHILTFYHRGYGIPIPDFIAGQVADSHLLPLVTIHAVLSALICWTLLRRYPAILAVFLGLLPMALCFVVTDTVPQLWCILLWCFALIMIVITQSVRLRDSEQGAHLARLLALPLALCLILMSVLVPQQGYQPPQIPFTDLDSFWLWVTDSLPFLGSSSDGGLISSTGGEAPQEVDLSTMGQRWQSNTPVMEVEGNIHGTIYLRGRDYDYYDSLSWSADPERVEWDLLSTSDTKDLGTLTIRVLSQRGQLYVPYYPDRDLTYTGGMVINEEGLTEYTFDCVEPDFSGYTPMPIPYTSQPDQRYLQLPTQTRKDALALLDEAGISLDLSVPNLAQQICAYVRGSATYDLSTKAMPVGEEDFAIWFLTQSSTGYCVHFATATTVLLRSAGIPARYVEGFAVEAHPGKTSIVRGTNAHAWVEYYTDGIGWRVLEPTPDLGETPQVSTTAPTETDPTDPPTTETDPTDPSTTEPSETDPTDPSTTAPSDPEPTDPSGTTPTGSDPTEESTALEDPQPAFSLPPWIGRTLLILLYVLIVVAMVILQWYLRRRHKQRKLYRGKINAQALERYREARRLAKLTKSELPQTLHDLAEKARYSQHRLSTQELSQFDGFLRTQIKAMQKRNIFLRLCYRLICAAY